MGVGHMGFSSCGLRAPKHWLSSWGARAQPLRGMWDPPRPGIELASPALPGRPLTTGPLGKPLVCSSLRLQVEQGEGESWAATVLTELNPVLPKHASSQVGGKEGREPPETPCLLTTASLVPVAWLVINPHRARKPGTKGTSSQALYPSSDLVLAHFSFMSFLWGL